MTAQAFGEMWVRRAAPLPAGSGDRRLLATAGMIAASAERHLDDVGAPPH